ncbi:MAG: hypothetical protein ACT4NY_16880 [Pseudonocardiales bacterium]
MNVRPTRVLIVLSVVVVVLGLAVGGLWWLDHRNSLTETARTAALSAARDQISTADTNVIASSVVRAEPDEVVLLLFVNQRTQGSQTEAVQVSAQRIVLTMNRVEGRWMISDRKQV